MSVSSQQEWHRMRDLVRREAQVFSACRRILGVDDFCSVIGVLPPREEPKTMAKVETAQCEKIQLIYGKRDYIDSYQEEKVSIFLRCILALFQVKHAIFCQVNYLIVIGKLG